VASCTFDLSFGGCATVITLSLMITRFLVCIGTRCHVVWFEGNTLITRPIAGGWVPRAPSGRTQTQTAEPG
jgi:hypothetical protein